MSAEGLLQIAWPRRVWIGQQCLGTSPGILGARRNVWHDNRVPSDSLEAPHQPAAVGERSLTAVLPRQQKSQHGHLAWRVERRPPQARWDLR